MQFATIQVERGKIYSRITTPINSYMYQVVRKSTSYYPEGYIFSPKYKSGEWDGSISLFKKRAGIGYTYPTGLEANVVEALQKISVSVNITDAAENVLLNTGTLSISNIIPQIFELRDYQKEAVQAIKQHKRGIINLPTGTGKTLTMAASILDLSTKNTLVVVYHSKDLLRQTASRLEEFLGVPVGKWGDGKNELQEVTVAISDSLARSIKKGDPEVLDYLKSVNALYTDETHHLRAETVQTCSTACPNANYRIGLSGTPFRDQGDDLEIQAYLGEEIYSKNLTWMVRNNYLVAPHVTQIQLQTNGWQPLPPDDTAPVNTSINGDGEEKKPNPYQEYVKEYIWRNPTRDKLIAHYARLLAEKGRRGLIMCSRTTHGEAIAEILGDDALYVQGANSTQERLTAINALTEGNKAIVICTTIFNEGVDIPPASFVIQAQPYRSNVITVQQQGRVLRPHPGKNSAVIVDLVDGGNKWLPKQGRKRLQYYNSEPVIAEKLKIIEVESPYNK